jgi:hypothetical protein
MHEPWLPDGATTYLLSYQKFQLGYISVGLGTQNVDMFYGYLVILLLFRHFFYILVYCSTKKNLATINQVSASQQSTNVSVIDFFDELKKTFLRLFLSSEDS